MSRISVDIGGTFSDAVYVNNEGRLFHGKGFTSHGEYGRGVMEAIKALGVDVHDVEVFPHGTTVALNAILEGKTAPTGLITTRGFRDVLEIARYGRKDMYDLQQQKPKPLVSRIWRLEVSERLDWQGIMLQALDPNEVRERLRQLCDGGIRSVAVCLLHAYRNGQHERMIKAIAAEEFPELTVSISSEVAPQWREFERTSSTILNASTAPIVCEYLVSLTGGTMDVGMRAPILVMQSNGGVMSAEDAKVRPIMTLMSGPVGGVTGAAQLARQLHLSKLMTLDVGGTSADVALILDGEPVMSTESRVGDWPILTHSVAIHSVGAGGGSLIRIGPGGAFRVGPESAGSKPGPVCYDRGGQEPTVTDANVCLGRIDPLYFLGGAVVLDAEKARCAFEENVLPTLNLTVEEAAEGAVQVINTIMARAIREIAVARGHDPAEFTLLAFGGGGGLHAALVAAAVGMRRVIVPPLPAHFSAMGILGADMRHDLAQMVLTRANQADLNGLNNLFSELRQQGQQKLTLEGFRTDYIQFGHSLEGRYVGQDETLTVPVSYPLANVETVTTEFADLHRQTYGYDLKSPVEFVSLRVTAIGKASLIQMPDHGANSKTAVPAATRIRRTYFGELGGYVDCPFYERYSLPANLPVIGPAIIEEEASTVLVPPGWKAYADSHMNLILDAQGE